MPNDKFECTNSHMCRSVYCVYRDAADESIHANI